MIVVEVVLVVRAVVAWVELLVCRFDALMTPYTHTQKHAHTRTETNAHKHTHTQATRGVPAQDKYQRHKNTRKECQTGGRGGGLRREGEGGGNGRGEGRERERGEGGIKGDLGTGGDIGIAGSLARQTVARARICFPPALAQSSPCCS